MAEKRFVQAARTAHLDLLRGTSTNKKGTRCRVPFFSSPEVPAGDVDFQSVVLGAERLRLHRKMAYPIPATTAAVMMTMTSTMAFPHSSPVE